MDKLHTILYQVNIGFKRCDTPTHHVHLGEVCIFITVIGTIHFFHSTARKERERGHGVIKCVLLFLPRVTLCIVMSHTKPKFVCLGFLLFFLCRRCTNETRKLHVEHELVVPLPRPGIHYTVPTCCTSRFRGSLASLLLSGTGPTASATEIVTEY